MDDYRIWVDDDRRILVRLWDSGEMEVAVRESPEHTWGPPVRMTEEANATKPVVHGGYVERGQVWQYKPNRGTGRFVVESTNGSRITMRRGALPRTAKTISVATLRGDYERVS